MSLRSLLNQTITLYTKSTKDKFGRESYGSGVQHKCRFQLKTKTRVLPNQEIVAIVAVVYLRPDVSIDKGDKVTYNGTDYRVYTVNEAVDGPGNVDHRRLELTEWA